MRMKPHPEDDGMRVWLSRDELARLIDTMHDRQGTPGRIAGRLGGHVGLRRAEATGVAKVDVHESHGDTFLRIEEDAKDEKYREPPLPVDLANQIEMIPEYRDDIGPDDPVLDVAPKTYNRWVKRAGEELYAETGDDGWLEISSHDLRRTYGTQILADGVLPSVVMEWLGHSDWETFRRHYLGQMSPEVIARERGKVDWLSNRPPEERPEPAATAHPAAELVGDDGRSQHGHGPNYRG